VSQRQDGPDEDVRVYSDEEIAEFLEADKAPPELAERADQLSRDLEARLQAGLA
jgi:hypothetical protein